MIAQPAETPAAPAAKPFPEGQPGRSDSALDRAPTGSPESGTPWGPGIVEVRPVTPRIFGIRVARRLIPKLRTVQGLSQATPRSDLFCLELPAGHCSPEEAVRRFKEMAAQAGMGIHFGISASRRGP